MRWKQLATLCNDFQRTDDLFDLIHRYGLFLCGWQETEIYYMLSQ